MRGLDFAKQKTGGEKIRVYFLSLRQNFVLTPPSSEGGLKRLDQIGQAFCAFVMNRLLQDYKKVWPQDQQTFLSARCFVLQVGQIISPSLQEIGRRGFSDVVAFVLSIGGMGGVAAFSGVGMARGLPNRSIFCSMVEIVSRIYRSGNAATRQ